MCLNAMSLLVKYHVAVGMERQRESLVHFIQFLDLIFSSVVLMANPIMDMLLKFDCTFIASRKWATLRVRVLYGTLMDQPTLPTTQIFLYSMALVSL